MNYRHLLFKGPGRLSRTAFTLVEVLVSLTVLVILLLISAQVIGTVQSTWTTSNARISQFREARTAFDIITRNLSQATLNTYIDYENPPAAASAAGTKDQSYVRKSDLRFVCKPATQLIPRAQSAAASPGHAIFFQAPLGIAHDASFVGLDRLLCGRGYFVQYTSDDFFRPSILPAGFPRYRYRLMEFSPPAESNLIYERPADEGRPIQWYQDAGVAPEQDEDPTNRGLTRPIADNIIALIISPQTEPEDNKVPTRIAPNFAYDSWDVGQNGGMNSGNAIAAQGTQHLLPPLVRVVLIAMDERSAERLSQNDSSGNPPFDTSISQLIEDSEAVNLNTTLENVSQVLANRRVNYRIFSATVVLRGAKWGN